MKPSNTNLWLFQPAWGLDLNIGSDQMAPSIQTMFVSLLSLLCESEAVRRLWIEIDDKPSVLFRADTSICLPFVSLEWEWETISLSLKWEWDTISPLSEIEAQSLSWVRLGLRHSVAAAVMDESAVKRIKSPDALTKGDSTVLAIITILTINIFIYFNLKKIDHRLKWETQIWKGSLSNFSPSAAITWNKRKFEDLHKVWLA